MGGVFEATLTARGYTSGHFPQSIARATVGGLVATRSAGQFSTKYGNIEDLLLGLEVVLPSGDVMRLEPFPRASTGPGAAGALPRQRRHARHRHRGDAQGLPAARAARGRELRLRRRMADGLEAIRRIVRPAGDPPSCASTTQSSRRGTSARRTRRRRVRCCSSCARARRRSSAAEMEACARRRARDGRRRRRPGAGRALARASEHGAVVGLLPAERPRRRHDRGRRDVGPRRRALRRASSRRCSRCRASWSASAHSSHSYAQGTNLYITFAIRPDDYAEAENALPRRLGRVMEATIAARRHDRAPPRHRAAARAVARARARSAYPSCRR